MRSWHELQVFLNFNLPKISRIGMNCRCSSRWTEMAGGWKSGRKCSIAKIQRHPKTFPLKSSHLSSLLVWLLPWSLPALGLEYLWALKEDIDVGDCWFYTLSCKTLIVLCQFSSFTCIVAGMCVMAGCDFLPSIHNVGIRKAHALLTKHRELKRVRCFSCCYLYVFL